MILRLCHVLTCEHREPVAQAACLLRLRPRALAWQNVRRFTLTAFPAPSKQRDGVDHFGNPVAWMFHDFAHERLEITSDGLIEVLARPAPSTTPPWEQVADAARNKAWAWREAEFAFPSSSAPALPEARAFAAPSFQPGRPAAEAALCLARRVGQEFRRLPTGTVSGALSRVLTERAGSGRDLAHVMIAGLRGLGLPARAVTGYAVTNAPAAAWLHAWTSCWLGPGLGWIDLEPGGEPVERRICLGWGRDHDEYSAVRGVLPGGAASVINARVELRPTDA